MSGYGQFCPVAVACEVFAERWTPLILRELFAGSRRFSEIRRGMPLISRALIYGAGRPSVVALLTLDAAALEAWVRQQAPGAAQPPLHEHPTLRAALEGLPPRS